MILFQEVAELLLTSAVQVGAEQLRALSSQSGSQFPSDGLNQPGDGGFLLANTNFGLSSEKSDLGGGGESSLTGVGDGGDAVETSSDEPTLYAFLFDLFGESLSLRLAGHEALKKKPSATQVSEPHPQQSPTSKDIRHVNRTLVLFLSHEGFKPIKVDLPCYLPPQRPAYGERPPWTFSIPRFVLPVQGNALERGMRMGLMQRQHAPRVRIKTGVGVSYKRHTHKLKHSSDIGSSWL